VLDNEHRETVAVRLGIDHRQLAYPDPIKATQPAGLSGDDRVFRDHVSDQAQNVVRPSVEDINRDHVARRLDGSSTGDAQAHHLLVSFQLYE